MNRSAPILVVGRDGLRGSIEPQDLPRPGVSGKKVAIRLEDGRTALVPAETLIPQEDGTYRMVFGPQEFELIAARGATDTAVGRAVGTPIADAAEGTAVVPVVREDLEVGKRRVETGRVRISKVVHEHEEVVDVPLLRETVEVERVPVNRYIEAPAEPRQEGETWVFPVVEEVLVVEKRLMIKEELRITRRQVEERRPQHVRLREEEAVVERIETESRPHNS